MHLLVSLCVCEHPPRAGERHCVLLMICHGGSCQGWVMRNPWARTTCEMLLPCVTSVIWIQWGAGVAF